MIIGFLEHGEVRVYANLPQAMEEWAKFPTDLLSEVITLFDDDGTWLKPVAIYAPRIWFPWSRKLMSVEMHRAKENENRQDTLGYLLRHEAVSLAKNSYVDSLQQLRLSYPWQE